MRLDPRQYLAVAWSAAALCASVAYAHGDEQGKAGRAVVKEQRPWGIAGEAANGIRTIRVTMNDQMRFVPDRIDVKTGETVRLVVKNDGNLVHEFVIGTREELDAHAALMKKFPKMEHDQPYMAHVAPGKTGEVIWTFNQPGDFNFACLIDGHYQAGMIGTIKVVAK